ncbi:hypothetical protein BDZ85DRAFT_258221 [Elsinoe ampelina]|uniref:REJ domain-containing protein n=1 Tax=Elsinoe ampelina TaxID=302913 RepID=A0A6A6GK48_9PEZI|nr:hypothetical protein BDZ85DRAFT_258221 [Elsinoe ampelina]
MTSGVAADLLAFALRLFLSSTSSSSLPNPPANPSEPTSPSTTTTSSSSSVRTFLPLPLRSPRSVSLSFLLPFPFAATSAAFPSTSSPSAAASSPTRAAASIPAKSLAFVLDSVVIM